MRQRFVNMIEDCDYYNHVAIKNVVIEIHNEIVAISKSKLKRMDAICACKLFCKRYDVDETELRMFLSPAIKEQLKVEWTYTNSFKKPKSKTESTHERTDNTNQT